jgi:hypothetical protein
MVQKKYKRMNLQEQISRMKSMMILNESEKDLSSLLEELLYNSIVKPNSDVVCKIKVKHPKDRKVLNGQEKYKSYSVTLYVIGGYGTKYWPQTMAVLDLYDDLMNQSWDIAHDFTNIPTDVYHIKVKSCDEI